MRILFLAIFLHYFFFSSNAQKPVMDSTVFGKWPFSLSPKISYDGNYSQYLLKDDRLKMDVLTISSNESSWRMKFNDITSFSFCANSRYSYFLNKGDSLGLITLGTNQLQYIPNVNSFNLSGNKANECLAYLLKDSCSTMVLKESFGAREKRFKFVNNYLFCNDGKVIVMTRRDANDAERSLVVYDCNRLTEVTLNNIIDYRLSDKGHVLLVTTKSSTDSSDFSNLLWVNLKTGEMDTIVHSRKSRSYYFNDDENALTFITRTKKDYGDCLYYYKPGMEVAKKLTDVEISLDKCIYAIAEETSCYWSLSGEKLLVLRRKKKSIDSSAIKGSPNVSVWNYKDERLPRDQRYYNECWFLVDIKDSTKVTQVTREGEEICNLSKFDNDLVISGFRLSGDLGVVSTLYRYNSKDGSREIIENEKKRGVSGISPSGSYIIWFDPDSLCYFTYDMTSGKTRNISRSIPLANADAAKIGKVVAYGIGGWSKDDRYVYVYDEYDIWRLDGKGQYAPENITNYVGKKLKVTFGIINWSIDKVIDEDKELLLAGYDKISKYNGFWKLKLGPKTNLVQESMNAYCYYTVRTGRVGFAESAVGERPIKSKDADKYLVQQMDASHFPNYYFTADFRSFTPVTDYHPEKAYNWLTAELINWTMSNGAPSQGILYKPENFDPHKKYPLIFDCYEKRSDQLNEFINPRYSYDRINIPYYVSNGYLVFLPDIYYSKGHNASGVLNSVVSAAKYLSSFPYIDSTKIGVQGHSFGGWETNLLVARTRGLFAAACEASGVSDELSAYDELSYGGGASQQYYEEGPQASPFGIGVTPWASPALYIENSPVFYVQQATTPLLLVAGTNDANVPYPQALEMYLAMRRAGKKAWLLEYENAGHAVFGGDARDYTIRMKQFFDYYLKGAAPPKWMTEGIPEISKGINSGFELDLSGERP
jgi:dipeptidyl aminopeptidase/acylaminoacyl peptidase